MFEYKIEILRVIDGDTVEARVDLGFHTFVVEKMRLWGINTPELHSRDEQERVVAQKAKDRLIELCRDVYLARTLKDKQGKYGRYLVQLLTNDGEHRTVNEVLLAEGLAKEYYP